MSRRGIAVRVLLGSVVVAGLLCAAVFVAILVIDERVGDEYSRGMRLHNARMLESLPPKEAMDRMVAYRRGIPVFSSAMWIVDEQDRVLASSVDEPLPAFWRTFPRPGKVHEDVAVDDFSALRLAAPEPRYLLTERRDTLYFHKDRGLKAVWGFVIALCSFLLTFSLLIGYLRKKSVEAKVVLDRLANGDLKARFAIQRFDELGSLLLDFNRMADEIELLVGRVREAESARRQLIQDLGHDLRTPLMSLQASLDALVADGPVMRREDRERILRTCRAEIEYFGELVEGLTFVAQMDEPRYKAATERVNLRELLTQQLALYQSHAHGGAPPLRWALDSRVPRLNADLLGDPSLLARMIRNLFDNAASFARRSVTATLDYGADGRLRLGIADDGPGMAPEEIEGYGKSRVRRIHRRTSGHRYSYGLGSTIVRRIVELHDGRLEVRSADGGTVVEIELPAAQH